MQDIQLTKHFKLSEFFVGAGLVPAQLNGQPQGLPLHFQDRLFYLCHYLLKPIREFAEVPIHITSGFRTAEHNKAVGGAANSLHLYGLATDFKLQDSNPLHLEMVFEFAVDQLRSRFSELILYRSKQDNQPLWIHIALPIWWHKEPQLIKEVLK